MKKKIIKNILEEDFDKKDKPELIKRIKEFHAYLKNIVINSGIQEGQFNYVIKGLEKQEPEFLISLADWLILFEKTEYKKVKDTLLQFEGIWDSYKAMNINHLPEQVLLRERQKKLRLAWFNRPRPKKGKKSNGNNPSVEESL